MAADSLVQLRNLRHRLQAEYLKKHGLTFDQLDAMRNDNIAAYTEHLAEMSRFVRKGVMRSGIEPPTDDAPEKSGPVREGERTGPGTEEDPPRREQSPG